MSPTTYAWHTSAHGCSTSFVVVLPRLRTEQLVHTELCGVIQSVTGSAAAPLSEMARQAPHRGFGFHYGSTQPQMLHSLISTLL